jgi:hypothetical protein
LKYQIYCHAFKNQFDLKQFTKNILKRNVFQILSSGEDFNFLMELFKRHPEYSEKVGGGVKHLKITPNLESFHIDLFRLDNTITDISWNTAIRGRGRTEYGDKMRELRESIDDQIKDFRKSQGILSHCPKCNEQLLKAPHVDHTPSFSSIVGMFHLSDETDFPSFHKRIAKLQFLCAVCNFKKGTSSEII